MSIALTNRENENSGEIESFSFRRGAKYSIGSTENKKELKEPSGGHLLSDAFRTDFPSGTNRPHINYRDPNAKTTFVNKAVLPKTNSVIGYVMSENESSILCEVNLAGDSVVQIELPAVLFNQKVHYGTKFSMQIESTGAFRKTVVRVLDEEHKDTEEFREAMRLIAEL